MIGLDMSEHTTLRDEYTAEEEVALNHRFGVTLTKSLRHDRDEDITAAIVGEWLLRRQQVDTHNIYSISFKCYRDALRSLVMAGNGAPGWLQ